MAYRIVMAKLNSSTIPVQKQGKARLMIKVQKLKKKLRTIKIHTSRYY
jgi:hypothetical protein